MARRTDQLKPLLQLASGAVIARSTLRFAASRASGPGGQHVNSTDSAVELRIHVDELPLSERERALLVDRLHSRISREGDLRITASARRSQLQNRRDAEDRLLALVDDAITPETTRVTSEPSRAVQAARRAEREHEQQRTRERRGHVDRFGW